MLTPKRHQIILDLLQSRGVASIQNFVDVTSSSESTIRRDLSLLEKEKKLKRVHGGAALLQQKGLEPSISEKSTKYLQEKEKIAIFAAGLIRNEDCIFIDAGTTTYQMIAHIQASGIKVVTNGITHLEALLEKNIDTYLTGGYVKTKAKALIGSGAVSGLEQYRFDKVFIGVNGIHQEYGFTTPDPEEATVKRLAIQLSQEAYVLSDHSKFHEVTFSKISDLNRATIITNNGEVEGLLDFQDKTTIKVVTT